MRLVFGTFTFDSRTRELLAEGRAVHLSPKAFDLLQLLLELRPGVVRKAEVQERIWAGTFVHEASLNVVVAEIRRVLGDDPRAPRFVRTVHRVGYAFCGAATDAAPSASAVPYSRCWLTWNERTFALAQGDNIIGRDPRCAVWIDASGVSRTHARVTVADDRVTIVDLASSNGTFVGREQISSERALDDRDVIGLGSATLEFRWWSEDRPPKTERLTGGRRKRSAPGA